MGFKMDVKTTISATEARKNFFKIIEKIDRTGVSYTLTVNGVPKAVIQSADEFDGWQETVEIMSDPELMESIREGEKEANEGKTVPFEEVFGKTPRQVLLEEDKK